MASPVTIQPSTADTHLIEDTPTTNTGTQTFFYVYPETTKRRRSILKFDLSASVPAGATITLTTLILYCGVTLASRTITVYRLLRTDWVEAQATWNIYKTGNNWTTAGALSDGNDFTSTDAATAASVAAGQNLSVTVTAQVQTALDSVAGVAHFLLADEGASATGGHSYESRNHVTEARRPKLYIEYIVPVLKTVNGLAKASVKTLRSSVVIASGKTWNGMA
jgi:hypothetical protein